MCRFPSVGSVDLRLAPLITFACGCHRSEKAASVHPTRKNAKSRLVEGSSRQTLVPTILWSENHYLYALSYLAIFFLPSLNQFTWLIFQDFSTLFRACKIDIPTTEATSVQCSVLPWRELLSVVMPFQLSFDRPLSKLLTTHFNTQNQRNFWDEA